VQAQQDAFIVNAQLRENTIASATSNIVLSWDVKQTRHGFRCAYMQVMVPGKTA